MAAAVSMRHLPPFRCQSRIVTGVRRSHHDGTEAAGGSLQITSNPSTGVRVLRINRPERFNAINNDIYRGLPEALKEAGQDWPNTRVTVLAGSRQSPYFSSGNDLSDFLSMFSRAAPGPAGGKPTLEQLARKMADILRDYVDAFIDFGPGLLIGAVHGPATGIAATILPLCDAAYASDSARFTTPFTKLSQSPEGCSTELFPVLMGRMRATEALALGGTLTAQEAKRSGLVTDVLPEANFEREVIRKAEKFARFPPEGFRDTLALGKFRSQEQRQILKEINRKECNNLVARWQSRECQQALIDFAQRRKKA